MIVTLEFSAAEEAKLRKKAEEKGVSMEKILWDAGLGIIAEAGTRTNHPVTVEEMHRAFDELAEILPKDLPSIPMDALRRERMYADDEPHQSK